MVGTTVHLDLAAAQNSAAVQDLAVMQDSAVMQHSAVMQDLAAVQDLAVAHTVDVNCCLDLAVVEVTVSLSKMTHHDMVGLYT